MGLISTAMDMVKPGNASVLGNLADNAASWVGLNKKPDVETLGDTFKIANQPLGKNPRGDLRGTSTSFRGEVAWLNQEKSQVAVKDKLKLQNTFCWSARPFEGKESPDFLPQVPVLIVHEFQPFQQSFIGQMMRLYHQMKQTGRNQIMEEIGLLVPGLLTKMTQGAPMIGSTLKNAMLAWYSKNPSMLYQTKAKLTLNNPYKAIQRIFTQGIILNSYQLPWINSSSDHGPKGYLSTQGNAKFTAQMSGGGGLLAELMSMSDKSKDSSNKQSANNLFSGIPCTPKYGGTLAAAPSVSTQFYLINKTNQWTVRNFVFMHKLAAGAFPVQLPAGILHCPNVYHVEIPGRRQLVWSQMFITITQQGQLRANEEITSQLAQTGLQAFKNSPASSVLWPQAWKLSITFEDFTPNTYNSYQHYLRAGSAWAQMEKEINSATTNMYQQIAEKIGNIVK